MKAQWNTFIDHYILLKSGTKAAIAAGYSEKTAHVQGTRLLKNDKIKAEIQKRLNTVSINTNVTAERVINELAKIAFANSKNFFVWDAEKNSLVPADKMTDDDAAAVASVEQTVTENGGSIKMRLHDKMKALDMLSRHLQLFESDANQAETAFNITFAQFPDDENSNRTATNG
jgi:phage terminase small subunit